jgi:hypothetical protein
MPCLPGKRGTSSRLRSVYINTNVDRESRCAWASYCVAVASEDNSPDASGDVRGEPRGPVVIVLLAAMCLFFFMPEQLLPGPNWLLPATLGCFLIALVVTDPGRIDRRSVAVHRIRLGLVVVLVAGSAWATVNLTTDLVSGSTKISQSASSLLRAGGLVWLALIITFSYLYWELDLGGPGERAHTKRQYPDLAFPPDLNPEIRPPGWHPEYVDYLYLGMTNSLAFSPTDVMPIAQWAKLAMGIQSIASLLILGLVIARAVNVLK